MLDKIKKGALLVAGIALCAALVYQLFLIYEAKDDRIKTQATEIIRLNGENKQLKDEAVKDVQSGQVTEKVKAATKVEEAKPEKAKTVAGVYVEQKLADIEKKYAAKEQNAANTERKRTEISLERAKGLWMTYCLQEPEVAACK